MSKEEAMIFQRVMKALLQCQFKTIEQQESLQKALVRVVEAAEYVTQKIEGAVGLADADRLRTALNALDAALKDSTND